MERHRMGDFQPTELGLRLMHIVTGPQRALSDVVQASRRTWRESGKPLSQWTRSDHEIHLEGTPYADAAAAQVHLESLELELRAPDGSVIPTEWIDVRDTELQVATWGDDEDIEDLDDFDGFDSFQDFEDRDPALMDDDELELLRALEHDTAILEEQFDALEDDYSSSYDPEKEGRPFPKYQIQVELLDDAAMP